MNPETPPTPTIDNPDRRLACCLDFGQQTGWGHLIRCGTLSAPLREQGISLELVTTSPIHNIPASLRADWHRIWWIDTWDQLEPQAINPDCFLVDHYGLGEGSPSWSLLCDSGRPTCVIVDSPEAVPRRASAWVNPNPYGGTPDRQTSIPGIGGPSCVLIRKGFRTPGSGLNLPKPFCVVLFGGTDVAGLTEQTLHWICQGQVCPGSHTVFVAPGFRSRDPLLREPNSFDCTVIDQPLDASSLSWLFRNARFGVSGAGGTLSELVCCQCPAIGVAIAPNQRLMADFARWVWKMPVLSLEHYSPGSLNQAIDAVQKRSHPLAYSPTVDTDGPSRVARLLHSLIP